VSRPDIIAPSARNWRDIPQQVKPRAMSPEGRRRVVWSAVKTFAIAALLSGLVWGGYEIGAALRGNPKVFSGAAPAVPVKEVELITDGVLNKEWLVHTLALPKSASLMQLDLYQLRARIIASRQVRSATLTRIFPATLSVVISEHSPVARVMAQFGDEVPHPLFVAREGRVFEGIGYDAEMVSTLPWLAGVKLVRTEEGFEPIAGMEQVADLLAKAKLEAEHLYRTWEVVSLERLQSDGEIDVRARDVSRIMFGTHEDFFRQLARLDALLDAARAKTDQPIREINLAIGSQVPVAFEDPALAPAAMADPKKGRAPAAATFARIPALPAFPNLQRKTKL
jgi:cell division protein FtsQ